MRNKSLFLLLAVVCGTVAAIGVNQWMIANEGKGTIETVEIFVTAQAIDEQEEITADKIRLEQWPADKVPAGSTSDLTVLEGRYAKQMFLAGEPVMVAKLMDEKVDLIVPKGYQVVSMQTNQNGGIANLVKQGDRVDVDAYFTKSDLIPETRTMTILAGVKVFAIDGKTKQDKDEKVKSRSARSISLLIRKADHTAWILAQKNGEVSLSLGSPGNDSDRDLADDEPSESSAGFLKWMEDHRAEQKRLREEAAARAAAKAAEQEEDDTTTPTVAPRSKKGAFRITKMVNGRMVVYEFIPGDPVPRIVADTGDPNGDLAEDDLVEDVVSEDGNTNTAAAEEDRFGELNGAESPFFQPDE